MVRENEIQNERKAFTLNDDEETNNCRQVTSNQIKMESDPSHLRDEFQMNLNKEEIVVKNTDNTMYDSSPKTCESMCS